MWLLIYFSDFSLSAFELALKIKVNGGKLESESVPLKQDIYFLDGGADSEVQSFTLQQCRGGEKLYSVQCAEGKGKRVRGRGGRGKGTVEDVAPSRHHPPLSTTSIHLVE